MGLILNIETATDKCSICIARNTEILALEESKETYSHASVITILIDRCIAVAGVQLTDLDAIAVSSGPGSYTALRIGAATAKGICYALNKPLITVDTLEALANAASLDLTEGDCFIPMIDARRMEVYASVYDHSIKQLAKVNNIILDETSFQSFFKQYKHVVFCGTGVPKSRSLFETKNAGFTTFECSAKYLAPLSFEAFQNANFSNIAQYAPTYFKAPNITKSKKTL